MLGTTGAMVRASFIILAAAGSRAFSPSFPDPTRLSGTTQQARRSSALMTPCMGMFGFGGGRSSAPSSSGDGSGSPSLSKARKAVESSAVFKSRTEQYARGALTAIDLVRSLEEEVANKIRGADLEDVVEAALEMIPDKRKRDLLSKASGGRAIGPGGATVSGASRGGADVTIDGQRGQYLMSQGGQRISSGKSSILNGVEVGKEGVPLKLKVTTLSSSASAAAEVANVELVRAKNGARVSSRHFVEFIEYIENYNGRGDVVMVMTAGSTDLRKVAEASGGGVPQAKLRKYASEMGSITRCLHKAGLVWTDLKLDNMVLAKGGELKAIDLESAVPARSAPKTFSPEAMPPEFAVASRAGFSGVTVDRSFDVWSLGMAILHLYLGRGYFEGMSDPQTIATLGRPGFCIDFAEVRDGRIRGMLEGLLDPAPTKRLRYFESPIGRLALL